MAQINKDGFAVSNDKPAQVVAPAFNLTAASLNKKIQFEIKDNNAKPKVTPQAGGDVVQLVMKKGGAK